MTHQRVTLDDIDRKILSALVANARTSFVEIGREVDLSPAAVKRRVDRMREAEVITGFTTLVRPSAIGWRTEAYVEVHCESAAPPRRLAEVARTYPEVVGAMTVTGGADALLHIRAADIEHFEEVLERIRAEPFVHWTNSVIVLSHLLPAGAGVGAVGAEAVAERADGASGAAEAVVEAEVEAEVEGPEPPDTSDAKKRR
ncbi:Lrp/AsnC family transcriptional regulator [Streptomyces armeniacus]|uniref:Lrp/AsnC family transcriptional regulator n=1 Tax=Streptomyces armeniacus TaxID=83291 RepID=A0A345XM43_9ACTN|nr:Lrp/AsnC family transcriptional regulator [Streptomyces armeniacus]AXK32709.1 Lrp/AsnC family transcriptional regulator [Streptomyces armeniacus]